VTKLLTSLTLIILAATAAFAQKESATKNVTFKDEKNRFSITYPPEWQAVPPDAGDQFKLTKAFGLYSRPPSVIVIGVVYRESEKDTPREKFIEDFSNNVDKLEAAYRQADPSMKIFTSGRTRLAGRDAFFTEMTATPKGARAGEKYILRNVFTWESGYYFVITLLTDEYRSSHAFAEFERIISTFTID
jgi:hypothetical protein